LVKEIVGNFLIAVPEHLQTLRIASNEGNAELVQQVAHKLRGSCGLLGAAGMAEICQRIERYGQEGHVTPAREVLPILEHEYEAVRPVFQAAAA
jgi:HPt (histidine-containing phosphotransfer) domain-containing protein